MQKQKKLDSPLVSVLVPAYNAGKYIKETIKSIQDQPYNNVEIIVANDCSSDNTVEVVQELQKKDKRIHLINNKKNLYIAENRNVLVAAAKGKYILWLDSDDLMFPNRVIDQVRLMESNPRLGIVGGYLELFFDDGRNNGVRKYPLSDEAIRDVIFRYSPISQGAAMIRREVFQKTGLYNPQTPPAEDLDMLFRIGEHYEFGNIDGMSLKYRQHDQSATRQRLRKIELTTVKTRFKYMFNKAYKFKVSNLLYNTAHYVSIWIIPSDFKIALFNKLRSNKS